MIYLKSCPKCRGDMYLDRDFFGAYLQCFQCALILEVAMKAPLAKDNLKSVA